MKTKFLTALAILIWISIPALSRAAEIAPAFETDIRRLLELTGSTGVPGQLAKAMTQQIWDSWRTAKPDMPLRGYEVLDHVVSTLFEKHADILINRLVWIYGRHFTHEEIKGLIAFYETGLGRKSIELMPVIMKERAVSRNQWIHAISPELKETVEQRFKDEGIEIPE
jgi:hypothetical protein